MAKKATNIMRRGRSWIVYFRVDGKQTFKSFADRDYGRDERSSKDAAMLYLEQSRLDQRRGEFRLPSKELFRDVAAEWLDEHPSLDPRTRQLYDQRIRDYLNPVLGDLPLSTITTAHVLRVKQFAEKQGRSGWTQRGILALLSGILGYAVPERISVNPVAALKERDRPKSKEGGRGPKRILTSDELRRLLAAAGEQYRPILAVAAYAGLRLSEVLGLAWGDIDFEDGTIHVQKQLSVPNPFDPTPAHRVDLKSDSDEGSDRLVFLHDDLAAQLKAHRGHRIPRPDEFVFRTSTGTPYTQSNCRRMFDENLDAVAIEWTTRCDDWAGRS